VKISKDKVFQPGIVLALLIFAAGIFFTYGQANHANDSALLVAHTQEVLVNTERLQSLANSLETGASAYLLTGQPKFLEIYKKSKTNLPAEILRIKQLTTDNPSQQSSLDSLLLYINSQISSLDSLVRRKNEITKLTELKMVINRNGELDTDNISRLIGKMQNEEIHLLELRKHRNIEVILSQRYLFFSSLLIMLGLTIFIFWLVKGRYETREKEKSRQLFRNILESSPDAIVIMNENGLILLPNSKTSSLFGYDKEEIVGKPVEILIPKLLSSEYFLSRKTLGKEPGKDSMGSVFELLGKKKDGEEFPTETTLFHYQTEDGILFSVSIRDITERKKSEEQIAYLASLIENTTDAIFSINRAYKIKSWNKGAELLYGYSAEESIGRNVEDVIQSLISDDERNEIRKELEGTGHWNKEVVQLKKDGAQISVLVTTSLNSDSTGKTTGYVCISRNITKRKQLEEQLKKSNAEMEAFSYSVSHDLRAPLRAITGFSSILEEEYSNKLDAEAQRITSVIKKSANRMGQLIDDLLAFSKTRRQAIFKTSIHTDELVREIINELDPKSDSIPINWIIHSLTDCKADGITLRQVWINLISNAIKYSGRAAQPIIEIGSFGHNGQTGFYIKDNGVGFDEKYKDKLFKVFQRLHSNEEFEGTGVGLSIVENIISKHEGKIWADGEINKGAAFYFSLPNK
jgi:PAS domain S-box-containing protein